jgi:hypothetical protein
MDDVRTIEILILKFSQHMLQLEDHAVRLISYDTLPKILYKTDFPFWATMVFQTTK